LGCSPVAYGEYQAVAAVGGEHSLVRQVDTGVARGPIRAQVEAQDLRQQNDSVESIEAVGFELVDEHGRNGGGQIALAEQVSPYSYRASINLEGLLAEVEQFAMGDYGRAPRGGPRS